MIHFIFSDKDSRYLFLKGDTIQDETNIRKLMKYINLVDPICYLKTYKGPTFTADFLFEYNKNGKPIWYSSIGMWDTFKGFFETHQMCFDGLNIEKYCSYKITHTFEEFKEIVNRWELKYVPRPYQYEAAYKILSWKRSLSELATRAGKTLIAYIVFRYMIEYQNVKKILMIVPSIELVQQGHLDFSEYKEFFKTECLWSGKKLVESSNLTISTFQTLIKFLDKSSNRYNPNFFNDFDLVFVDETHRATSKSISSIISHGFMKNVKLIFGMTGTIPGDHTIERYCLHSLIGPKIQEIKPKELIDSGYISPVEIIQHRIKYSNTEKELNLWIQCAEYAISDFVLNEGQKVPLDNPYMLMQFKKTLPTPLVNAKNEIYSASNKTLYEKNLTWKSILEKILTDSPGASLLRVEQMMIQMIDERINYLLDILDECPKNTLILAQHREYIKYIYEKVKNKHTDRPILYVIGGSSDRKNVKDILSNNNNCILIASYAIMGTGITLSNLCYGVLFESYKSEIINMQSIGRGLGLSNQKSKYILHDITDVFSLTNKIYLQGVKRIKIYKNNEYDYSIINKII